MSTERAPFPTNPHNLVNGTFIEAIHPKITEQLNIPQNTPFPIGWDGEYVRFYDYTWSVDQICAEIDAGYWRVTDRTMDLSNPDVVALFNRACPLAA